MENKHRLLLMKHCASKSPPPILLLTDGSAGRRLLLAEKGISVNSTALLVPLNESPEFNAAAAKEQIPPPNKAGKDQEKTVFNSAGGKQAFVETNLSILPEQDKDEDLFSSSLTVPGNSNVAIENSFSPLFSDLCCCCNSSEQKHAPCPVCRLTAVCRKLSLTGKLSAAGQKAFIETINTNFDGGGLTIKQLRFLRHLLEYLAANCSFLSKDDVTAQELKNWLDDCPSANIKSDVRRFINASAEKIKKRSKKKSENETKQTEANQDQGGVEATGNSAAELIDNFDLISDCAKSKTNSEQKNRIEKTRRKRKKVSFSTFEKVAMRQGSFCYWCGVRVAREARIPVENRFVRNDGRIVYLNESGELSEAAIGTIDHLVRVADSGNNNPLNLVISCLNCNHEREKITTAYNRPFARRRIICSECGGKFFYPAWGCCSVCGSIPERAGLIKRSIRKLIKKVVLFFTTFYKKILRGKTPN